MIQKTNESSPDFVFGEYDQRDKNIPLIMLEMTTEISDLMNT